MTTHIIITIDNSLLSIVHQHYDLNFILTWWLDGNGCLPDYRLKKKANWKQTAPLKYWQCNIPNFILASMFLPTRLQSRFSNALHSLNDCVFPGLCPLPYYDCDLANKVRGCLSSMKTLLLWCKAYRSQIIPAITIYLFLINTNLQPEGWSV